MGQADTFNSPTLFLRKNRYLPGEHPEVRARCQIRAAIEPEKGLKPGFLVVIFLSIGREI